jgi:hypothetical protein
LSDNHSNSFQVAVRFADHLSRIVGSASMSLLGL